MKTKRKTKILSLLLAITVIATILFIIKFFFDKLIPHGAVFCVSFKYFVDYN